MAFPLARVGDTRIYVHVTMILAALTLLISGYGFELIVLMGSLVLHEIGHILGASFAGNTISRIDLWPFGAVGKISDPLDTEPRSEILTALGGPITSAFVSSFGSFVRLGLEKMGGVALSQGYPLLSFLIEVNLGLMTLNLLPCLPLDGGRVLRSSLSLKVGYVEASKRVARLGRWMGVLMTMAGVVSLFLGKAWYFLAVAGPIILWGAKEEEENSSISSLREILRRNQRLKEGQILAVEEIMVSENAKVSQVMHKLKPSKYHIVLIMGKNMKVIGRITEREILDAFYVGRIQARMRDLLSHE